MQVIKSKTVVKLSRQELEYAVRLYVDKEKGFWIDELDIEVDGLCCFKSLETTSQDKTDKTENTASTKSEEYFWYSVPEDWENKYCPDSSVADDSKIEVIFRNGKSSTVPLSRQCWVQEKDPYDIVKYRVIEY